MLYREIMAVCSEIHTKHINKLCGQNVNRWMINQITTKHERVKLFSALVQNDNKHKLYTEWQSRFSARYAVQLFYHKSQDGQ